MNENEAIERIKDHFRVHDDGRPTPYLDEAVSMAIDALKKQVPYKQKDYEDKFYACKCGNPLMPKWKKYPVELIPKREGLPYCLSCGQKLDWSE